jgi:hypothetical protein
MKHDTQHKDSYQNGTLYRLLLCLVLIILSVTNKPIMLSAIMLSVITMNVVAPLLC